MAGTLSLPRPMAVSNSNTAQPSARYAQQLQTSHLYVQRVVIRCFFGGLSFDDSSEVFEGGVFALAVGNGKVRDGSGSASEEGVTRAEPQRERNGGVSFLATTNTSRFKHKPPKFISHECRMQ